MIQAIVIVILSIAVLFCSKCVYDLNKRISTMQRHYDSILYHNTQLHDVTKKMMDILNSRYIMICNLFENLNEKYNILERNKNLK